MSEDSDFCPNCGEKKDGDVYVCVIPSCQAKTTKLRCPKCLGSYTCPKCKKTSVNPVCTACNVVLDRNLEAQAQQAQIQEAPV